MQFRSRSLIAVIAVVVAAVGVVPRTARAEGYDDPDYAAFDLDNVSRSSGRQLAELTDPQYQVDFASTALESHVENQLDQVRDAPDGRVYAGLGQLLPGGSVGDPKAYHEVASTEVDFLFRSGAKLEGHLFAPVDGADPAPAVVITTGSIQGTQHMYWWAARTLAEHGYLVFTWDVQGQGESETTPHAPGETLPFVDPGSAQGYTTDGVPFQQPFNFSEGTIDALRFFTSTPEHPYVPGGWTADDLAAAKAAEDAAGERIDWVNPLAARFDGEHLGIAGHSLGATAVSRVQQCSDASDRYLEIIDFCTQSFPIRAVVAWDRLTAGTADDPYVPVVPGMDQQADGYFLNPAPTPTPPTRDEQFARVEDGAFAAWRAAGLDTYSLTVRGGLHTEWTEVPYILGGTTYGTAMADYYTLAWMDRFVSPDRARNAAALDLLRSGPVAGASEQASGAVLPWRADLMSARFAGGFSLSPVPDRPATTPAPRRYEAVDLRAYAGLSPVGDWAGANADRPDVAPAN